MIERHSGCIHEARRMFSEYHGGEIWRVTGTNTTGEFYLQNYFIPPNAIINDLALNGADNGYLRCEQLTVEEVRARGRQVDPFSIV